MASNQVRRENLTGEREVQPITGRARSHHTVGQMGGGFGASGQKESYGNVVADEEAQGHLHSGQEESIMSHEAQGQQQPSLEEIGKYRGIAQQNSMEALMAAENRYAEAKQSQTQRKGQESTEETVEGYGMQDTLMSAAEKTKDTVLSAAEKARDVAVPAGKTAAQYAGKAAVGAKDMAVKAGWSTAQLTASAAVEGTKMAANAVQGVAGYVAPTVANVGQKGAEMAANSFNTATNAAVSTGQSAREYAARKKEEAQRDMDKKASMETQGDVRPSNYSTRGDQVEGGGSVLEAVGETVAEIGQTTKDLVTGKGVVAAEDAPPPRTRGNNKGASQY